MIPGLSGSLLSHDAIEAAGFVVPADPGQFASAADAFKALDAVLTTRGGPSWPARSVLDQVAIPLLGAFGFDVVPTGGSAETCVALLRRDGAGVATLIATGWGREPASGWRESVLAGIAARLRWCLFVTGPSLRIFDAERTHSRRYVEFDLATLCRRAETQATARHLLSRGARSGLRLDEAVILSEAHRSSVRESLQAGVHDALGRLTTAFAAAAGRRGVPGRRKPIRRSRPSARPSLDAPQFTISNSQLLDESLVVIYRVLFLLFAEARGLVPVWHPIYRDAYTVEALRQPVEVEPERPGIWDALQAIARLAHRGCRAGSLRVPPFNGHLFSPEHAPLADAAALDDAAVSQALLALTTRITERGRVRISYADLGVEQLGGVYERVLDYDIGRSAAGEPQLVPGGRRKSTGTFYTPRSLTEYLVRRTLAPLVEGATPEAILRLKVLDPAMGSGAFLVAACRYLAHAYELALVRAGMLSIVDITEGDRAHFRRLVAQRTLFGVDRNPMAVQLARLSLWLATLSSDRPLTFFDHRLRVGNSLVGASLHDLTRRPGGSGRTPKARPLLDLLADDSTVALAVSTRQQLVEGREDTIEQVRAKESLLATLLAPHSPLSQWKAIADLWCAAWFDRPARAVNRATFSALVDTLLDRPGRLAPAVAGRILGSVRDIAARERFFHWELEFPEVFHAADGRPLASAGFDAVIGNPPWEMLRADDQRRDRPANSGVQVVRFARGSGIYRLQGTGHTNLYQLFVERSLSLVRAGGRVGVIVPSGLASDHGSAGLRTFLLNRTRIDSLVLAENREALFPIHRGLKFALLTLTRTDGPAGGTAHLPLRAGVTSTREFDRLPTTGKDPLAVPLPLAFVERVGGAQLSIPEIRTEEDAALAGHLALAAPAAADPEGWGLRFGRELNATDDRAHFNQSGRGIPVIEGKQIAPFVVDLSSARNHVEPHRLETLFGGRRPFERPRLAYRDVASSSNRLTLIATVLPPGTITTHTLFCLKTLVEEDAQHFLAGLFNSFVLNYFVRLRVTTHVTVGIVEQLPVPRPAADSPEFRLIAGAARRLARGVADRSETAAMQACVAHLFSLRREQFSHLLGTFPLVDEALRRECLDAYSVRYSH